MVSIVEVQGLADWTNTRLKIFAFNSGTSTKKMYTHLLFLSLGTGCVLIFGVLTVRGYSIKQNLGQYYGSGVLRFKSLRILVRIFFVSSDLPLQRYIPSYSGAADDIVCKYDMTSAHINSINPQYYCEQYRQHSVLDFVPSTEYSFSF